VIRRDDCITICAII